MKIMTRVAREADESLMLDEQSEAVKYSVHAIVTASQSVKGWLAMGWKRKTPNQVLLSVFLTLHDTDQ